MCCSLGKDKLKFWGILLCSTFLIGAVICIILAGVNYNITNAGFTQGGWNSLAAVSVASIIYVFATFVIGIFTFCCDWWLITVIFSILMMISLLFTFAIAVFGLIAGSVNRIDNYVGCQTNITGVMDTWANIDTYLLEVDSSLCSDNCPCGFSNPGSYTGNATVAPYFDTWNSTGFATSFQNCSAAVQQEAARRYSATPGGVENPIDTKSFAGYWAVLEEKFECSGWCQTNYTNPYTNVNSVMFKYMFSSINRGPPTYLGCLNRIIEWLPPILVSFGAIALAISILQAIVWFMAVSLCCAHQNKKDVEHNAKV